MAKLTGAAKAHFLAKMAAGRKKAAKTAPKRKNPVGYQPKSKHKVTLIKTPNGWEAPKNKRASIKSGTRVNPKRRTIRRNPGILSQIKDSILNKGMLIKAAAGGAGFIGGVKLQTLLATQTWATKIPAQYHGALNVIAGLLLIGLGKKDIIKAAGLGLAGSGVYDLVAANIAAAGIPKLGASVSWGGADQVGDPVMVGNSVSWGDAVQVGDLFEDSDY